MHTLLLSSLLIMKMSNYQENSYTRVHSHGRGKEASLNELTFDMQGRSNQHVFDNVNVY